MHIMLPATDASLGSLAEVIRSCLGALQSEDQSLNLKPATTALLVVIDGLGDENLRDYSGHARNLWADRIGFLNTVFPSTTASALTSLTTGELPGRHGIVGYRVRHPEYRQVINQLSGWGKRMDPQVWQLCPTLIEQSDISAKVFAEPKHQYSGFTQAVLRGMEYIGVKDIEERFQLALQAVNTAASIGTPFLGYLYISDLDQVAHKSGVGSPTWIMVLEKIDQLYAHIRKQLSAGVGMILTSDHGVINVPGSHQIVVDVESSLFDGVTELGGEPRGLQLYLEKDATDAQQRSLQELWQKAVGPRAQILTKTELKELGIFGELCPEVETRLGDIFVLAQENYAFYRSDDLSGQSMVGQHGSITATELFVPLILAGEFSKTD